MPTLTSLTVNLRGDSSNLVKATSRGLKAVRGLAGGIAKVGAVGLGGLGVATAGVAALGKASAENVDRLAKLSTNLGATVDETQQLELVSDLTGVGIDRMSRAFQRLTRNVGDLERGVAGSQVSDAFGDLFGGDVPEFAGSTLQTFQQVIGELGKVTDTTQRASIANALFGRSWQELAPVIEGGAGAFQRASFVFDQLGLGLTKNAGAVEMLNDNATSLGTLFTALRDKVFAGFAPVLNQTAEAINRTVAGMILANGGGEQLAQTIVTNVLGAFRQVATFANETLRPAIEGISAVVGFLVDVIQSIGVVGAGLGAAAGAALSGNFAGAGAILGSIPGDAAAQFDSGEKQLGELERQTQLLEDIASEQFAGVFS